MEVQNLLFWACVEWMRREKAFVLPNIYTAMTIGLLAGTVWGGLCIPAIRSTPSRVCWIGGSAMAGTFLGWLSIKGCSLWNLYVDGKLEELIKEFHQVELTPDQIRGMVYSEPKPLWCAGDAYLKVQTPALDQEVVDLVQLHPEARKWIRKALGDRTPQELCPNTWTKWFWNTLWPLSRRSISSQGSPGK